MIGDTYCVKTWNCTHEVAQWYRINSYNIDISPVDPTNWGMTFVRWMRKHFDPVASPEQGSLVLMTNKMTGGLHVGVWDNGMLHHCYQPPDGSVGQTIRTPLPLVKVTHRKITFWRVKNV